MKVPADAILAEADYAAELARVIRHGAEVARQEGRPISPRLRGFADEVTDLGRMHAAAMEARSRLPGPIAAMDADPEMAPPLEMSHNDDELWTVRDVARFLARGERMVRNYAATGDLPATRSPRGRRQLLFVESRVRAWATERGMTCQ